MLYVVGVPIGNLSDITLRALQVLSEVSTVICEDTRVTSRLLNHHIKKGNISGKPRYLVCNDHNEREVYKEIADKIESGENMALVSDAGMPVISDPGYRVIRECFDRGIKVEVVPGPSAVSSAISLSGIGGKNYMFVGYLPKKLNKRQSVIETIKRVIENVEDMKIVMFVTPHKLGKDLEILISVLKDKKAVLIREMTKVHEERIEASLTQILEMNMKKKFKGEMVLIISNS